MEEDTDVQDARRTGRAWGAMLGCLGMGIASAFILINAIRAVEATTISLEHVVSSGHADFVVTPEGHKKLLWKADPDTIRKQHAEELMAKDLKIQQMESLLDKSSEIIGELEDRLDIHMALHIPEEIEGLQEDVETVPEEKVGEKVSWFSNLFKKKVKDERD